MANTDGVSSHHLTTRGSLQVWRLLLWGAVLMRWCPRGHDAIYICTPQLYPSQTRTLLRTRLHILTRDYVGCLNHLRLCRRMSHSPLRRWMGLLPVRSGSYCRCCRPYSSPLADLSLLAHVTTSPRGRWFVVSAFGPTRDPKIRQA
jgi:hypothetical protein